LDIQITPEGLVPDDKKIVVEKKIEVERIVEKKVKVPVERIIEKPVVVEREKLVTITDVKTEAFYEQLADLNSSVEKTKELVKQALDQMKYIASDPNKLKSIEELLSKQFSVNIQNIDSVKTESYKNLNVINQSINEIKTYIDKNKPSTSKDYTGDLNTIIRSLESLKLDLNSLNKLSDLSQYLTTIKSSIDRINVTPQVNVTTQKIEDENTKKALSSFTETFIRLESTILKQTKELENRMIQLESLVQKHVPDIYMGMQETVKIHQQVSDKLQSQFKQAIDSYKIEDRIKQTLTSYMIEKLKEDKSLLMAFFLELDKKIQLKFENSDSQFERVVNQKIFDLTLQLQTEISSILKSELNNYLSTINVEVPTPEVTVKSEDSSEAVLSLLGIVKQTIQNSLRKSEPTIVDSYGQLKTLPAKIGDEACVRKYGLSIRRPKWFKFNGEVWI